MSFVQSAGTGETLLAGARQTLLAQIGLGPATAAATALVLCVTAALLVRQSQEASAASPMAPGSGKAAAPAASKAKRKGQGQVKNGDCKADTTDNNKLTSEAPEETSKVPEEVAACPVEDSLEPWEVPLPDGPPTDSEKSLRKVIKKLREIKRIESLIQAGEPVEANQWAKVEKRQDLVEEWQCLYADVFWEREHEGASREFVAVRAGVPASKLRSEASRRVEEAAVTLDSALFVPFDSPTSPAAAGCSAAAPAASKKKSAAKRRAAAKAAKGAADDEGEWVTVGNDGRPKDKLRETPTAESKAARQELARVKQAMKVQSPMSEEYRLTQESLKSAALFSPEECLQLEELIDQVVIDAQRGLFKERTVDLTPMRNKYFFGFAYTYGAQKEHPGARGIEAVWPPEETSEIPDWIREMIVSRLEDRKIVPRGWINSATINDYAAGGCIVSHIDPPHLFDRPIISVSFFSDCNLVFGTRFSFPREAEQDIETSIPVLVHPCQRGYATVLKGYSANKITHAIRPCDLPSRRASIILRRVLPTAPVLAGGKTVPLAEYVKGS
eukprot:TRINITY_DN104432_c0_g1_i1.p1 TRINITY_DN104432_c0_g1~~TRINITY_DN104432_c0_g1_i1.p1  ORF type:complete len:557 (-),score=127.69 TRINITY_DN104432_c0_g1_i1:33-1703(-)